MLGGCFQLFHGGQLVVGIRLGGFGSFAVIVPDIQHAAHGNVQLAVGGLVHLVGQLQHGEDAVVHLHRSAAGIVVDGLDVGHAGVIVVDIIQLVIGNKVCVQGIHLGVEFFLALAVGDHLRYGIEHIIKNGGIAGKLFLFGGTACQQAQAEHPGQQGADETFCAGLHTVWFSFAAVKAACSSCRWASRSPNTQLRLEGVTTALSGMVTCACFIRSSRVSTSFSLKLARTTAGG